MRVLVCGQCLNQCQHTRTILLGMGNSCLLFIGRRALPLSRSDTTFSLPHWQSSPLFICSTDFFSIWKTSSMNLTDKPWTSLLPSSRIIYSCSNFGKCATSFVTSRGVNIKSDKHFHRNSRKLVVAVHYIKEEDMLVNI